MKKISWYQDYKHELILGVDGDISKEAGLVDKAVMLGLSLFLAGEPVAEAAKKANVPQEKLEHAIQEKNLAKINIEKLSQGNIDKVINALIQIESSGNSKAVGDNGQAIGILQIHPRMVKDVNRIAGTKYVWPRDCYDVEKSRDIAKIFLENYCMKRGMNVYNAARCWNGGPSGHKKDATLGYLKLFKRFYGN